MTALHCLGTYPNSHRGCDRPLGHDGTCGGLVVTRERFDPPRPITDYWGEPGYEVGGQRLSLMVLDGHAAAVMRHVPEMYVVTGELVREDGVSHLVFGVSTAYIEATSDFREVPGKGMVYVCPECEGRSGKHSRGCKGA